MHPNPMEEIMGAQSRAQRYQKYLKSDAFNKANGKSNQPPAPNQTMFREEPAEPPKPQAKAEPQKPAYATRPWVCQCRVTNGSGIRYCRNCGKLITAAWQRWA